MNGLIDPFHLAGAGVHRHHGGTKLAIQRVVLHAPQIHRRAAGWHIDSVGLRVVRHGRPHVRGGAGEGFVVGRGVLVVRFAGIKCPTQLAGDHVKTAHHAARHIRRHVIRHAAAHHDGRPGERRGRGRIVQAGIRAFTHLRAQADATVIAKVFAELTGICVQRDQFRGDAVHDDPALTLGIRRQ